GNRRNLLIVMLVLLLCAVRGEAAVIDSKSDTWVATDAFGRTLPGYKECGPQRSGKFVGIFYFLWLGEHGTGGPYDISKLLAANPSNPAWGPVNAFHHWGESELGYYLSNDSYVVRRHCQELVDAGVDVIIFDATNGFTYTDNYMKLCSVYSQIRSEGGNTPQIAFMAHSSSDAVVTQLYNDFYSQNLYPELWFRWLGKPVILSPKGNLPQNIRDFFTFRNSWAWSTGQDQWPWLDNYPQTPSWHVSGVPEEISVCVAQHPVSNIGRSFHGGAEPPVGSQPTEQGLCFAEQWRRALEVDPEFIFITGWNEWVAQRFLSDGNQTFLGQPLPSGGTFFVDEYNQEYSRDIEPMKGGHTDNYYYQMIDGIRRFKGVRAPEAASAPKTITIDGGFSDWTDVQPEYRDTMYDTTARNAAGWGSAGTYVNTTGRNDFVKLKVAYDATYVYFYAETRANMTSYTGANWMMLFIDSDRDPSTGWQGYDYLVNWPPSSSSSTSLKRNAGGWNWTSVRSTAYRYTGNKMEIRVLRSDIGQAGTPQVNLDFHWVDNIQKTGDITEFFVSGDSAPDRRFSYRYSPPPASVTNLVAAGGDGQITLSRTNPSDADFAGTVVRCKAAGYPG
ncbi:MAG TPA: hypothetical protein VHS06_09715, partial [Chloroflexota bacterium]|nr:hypothetical protein [Chloroflexota bacterium]